jgi:hypothetical protein
MEMIEAYMKSILRVDDFYVLYYDESEMTYEMGKVIKDFWNDINPDKKLLFIPKSFELKKASAFGFETASHLLQHHKLVGRIGWSSGRYLTIDTVYARLVVRSYDNPNLEIPYELTCDDLFAHDWILMFTPEELQQMHERDRQITTRWER